ncbi:MAG: iron ABC transporter permease [Actinomycetaceae bacterium]|nr:iron ABC transporter permease [Actinomycetaceae bacterium]
MTSISNSRAVRHIHKAVWRTTWVLLALAPAIFLGIFFAWPTVTLVLRGFISEGGIDMSAFQEVFARRRTWRLIFLTLGMATSATALSIALGLPAAHTLYLRTFPGRTLLRGLVSVPFVLPAVVVGVAFRSLLDAQGPLGFLGISGGPVSIVLAMVFFNFPLVVRIVGSFWLRLDNRPTHVARALGATPTRAFMTVTLPALLPSIGAAGAVVFLFCATSFGLVLVMGGTSVGTIETEIYILTTQFLDLRGAAVLSVVQLIVVIACLALAAKMSANTPSKTLDIRNISQPLSLRDTVPASITFLITTLLLALPLVTLAWRSLHRAGTFTLDNFLDLGRETPGGVLQTTVLRAVLNSIQIALVAAVIAVFIGIAVSLVVTRRPHNLIARATAKALDAAFMLPLGVSAVTVGFGFLITLVHPPFDLRASWWIVPLAQAVVAIPLVIRNITPVLRAIPRRQYEAAAVLGANAPRRLLTIDWPYLWRASSIGLGFALAMSLGEFGATSFVARPATPTLPIAIFRLMSRPEPQFQGMALAASILLSALAAAIMVLAERLNTVNTLGSYR